MFVGRCVEARGHVAVQFDIRGRSSRYLNDICNLDVLDSIEMEGVRPVACMASVTDLT
jgi:hypothetical protein